MPRTCSDKHLVAFACGGRGLLPVVSRAQNGGTALNLQECVLRPDALASGIRYRAERRPPAPKGPRRDDRSSRALPLEAPVLGQPSAAHPQRGPRRIAPSPKGTRCPAPDAEARGHRSAHLPPFTRFSTPHSRSSPRFPPRRRSPIYDPDPNHHLRSNAQTALNRLRASSRGPMDQSLGSPRNRP